MSSVLLGFSIPKKVVLKSFKRSRRMTLNEYQLRVIELGEEVKERPVRPAEVIGSMYALLGIGEQAKHLRPQGEEAVAAPVETLNLLKEIM